MRTLIKKGINAYLNLRSFKTDKRYLIIESDDWGSIRTKDNITREKLNTISNAVKQNSYCQLDSIASADDLNNLFEVLGSVHDKNGKPACMTPNVCTANPHFERIKASDYEEFFFKPFTKALDDYSEGQSLFKIWQNGIRENVFIPQLHGREHLHAIAWLNELRAGNTDLLKAFELETWGIPYQAIKKQKRANLQAALDKYNYPDEIIYHKEWIKDSASIFKSNFGYHSKSFIAPAYIWYSDVNQILVDSKIKAVQGLKLQYLPLNTSKSGYKLKPHYTGEVDKKSGLIYTVRNAFIEPYSAPNQDWVDSCLSEVKNAFEYNKPAILSTHRINYIGRLNKKHRDKNLKTLKSILIKIKKHYPDVQFIDGGSLAEILSKR